MKKIWIACAAMALMISACILFIQNKEEKFVNPVFYEKMISASHSHFELQLTPTSIYPAWNVLNIITKMKKKKHRFSLIR